MILLICLTATNIEGECNLHYNRATWDHFSGRSALGTIIGDRKTRHVTMTANYPFGAKAQIYDYSNFTNFNALIPASRLPATLWPAQKLPITTIWFDSTVNNPVLLVATLGDPVTKVKLTFSLPFQLLYLGEGITDYSDSAITGEEGYVILMFPGSLNCVNIYSGTTENWTNLTWALNSYLFKIHFEADPVNCGTATVTASGVPPICGQRKNIRI